MFDHVSISGKTIESPSYDVQFIIHVWSVGDSEYIVINFIYLFIYLFIN